MHQEEHCYVALDKLHEDDLPELPIERRYELPDGQMVTIGTAELSLVLLYQFLS